MVIRPAAESMTLLPGSSSVHTDGWTVQQAGLEAGRAYQETHPAYAAPLSPPDYSSYTHSHNEPSISNTQVDAEKPITNNNKKNEAMEDTELTAPKHEQQQQRMEPALSPSRCGGCLTCKKVKSTRDNNNSTQRSLPAFEPRPAITTAAATAEVQQQHTPITIIITPIDPSPAATNDARPNTSKGLAYLLLFARVFFGAYHFISSQCVSYEWSVVDCEAKGGQAVVKVVKGIFWGSNTLVCELPDGDGDAWSRMAG